MAEVKSGDQVKVHYTVKLEEGTLVDSSEQRAPLEFSAGSREVIPGVSNGVLGMEIGQQRSITVPPEDAYGQRDPNLEQTVPRDRLPEEVKAGDQLTASQGERQMQVWVKEVTEEQAIVDANHPLAGRTLLIDLELLDVQPATA